MTGALTMDTAPVADDDEDRDCPICTDDGCYVRYDGDTVCRDCGHVAGAGKPSDEDDHTGWREYRRKNYSGWKGEERIKFPGGFASAYDWGSDWE